MAALENEWNELQEMYPCLGEGRLLCMCILPLVKFM